MLVDTTGTNNATTTIGAARRHEPGSVDALSYEK